MERIRERRSMESPWKFPGPVSAALEHGGALAEEGGNAFPMVLRLRELVLDVGFELEEAVEVGGGGGREHPLGHADGQARRVGELARERRHAGVERRAILGQLEHEA